VLFSRLFLSAHTWDAQHAGRLRLFWFSQNIEVSQFDRLYAGKAGHPFHMSTVKATSEANPTFDPAVLAPERGLVSKWRSTGLVAATSFMFAVLQSVCTFFFALGAIRLMFGATALVAASQAGMVWDRFHSDSIRWPMMLLSIAGLVISWASLRRVKRIRENPSSQWRRVPLSPRQARLERWQTASQIATVILLALEEGMHLWSFHRF
jgi:hypothetical protein